MKKSTKIFTTVSLIGVLLVGCAASAAQIDRIDRETAKAAAITAAGLDGSDVRVTSLELERRNGIEYYDVDFVANGIEYEYDIDALTGKVIASEGEKETKSQRTPVDQKTETPAATAGLTEEEAKKIALSQVPGADESHILRFGIDYDDGKLEYEGTIIFEEMEYEFEIDGHSGAIRDWDVESVYD